MTKKPRFDIIMAYVVCLLVILGIICTVGLVSALSCYKG